MSRKLPVGLRGKVRPGNIDVASLGSHGRVHRVGGVVRKVEGWLKQVAPSTDPQRECRHSEGSCQSRPAKPSSHRPSSSETWIDRCCWKCSLLRQTPHPRQWTGERECHSNFPLLAPTRQRRRYFHWQSPRGRSSERAQAKPTHSANQGTKRHGCQSGPCRCRQRLQCSVAKPCRGLSPMQRASRMCQDKLRSRCQVRLWQERHAAILGVSQKRIGTVVERDVDMLATGRDARIPVQESLGL